MVLLGISSTSFEVHSSPVFVPYAPLPKFLSIKVGLTKNFDLTHLCRSRQLSPRVRPSVFSGPGTHQANTYRGPTLLDCLPAQPTLQGLNVYLLRCRDPQLEHKGKQGSRDVDEVLIARPAWSSSNGDHQVHLGSGESRIQEQTIQVQTDVGVQPGSMKHFDVPVGCLRKEGGWRQSGPCQGEVEFLKRYNTS